MCQSCPLCLSAQTSLFNEVTDKAFGKRTFFTCALCHLIFLDAKKRLSIQQEKDRYDLHENDPADERYVDFLNILLEPLADYLRTNAKGLDFGCGPGPATSRILKKQGFHVDDYDPIFKPQKELLNKRYDFIACSEVVEHFYQPSKEFELLNGLLNDSGVLGVMTQVYKEGVDFSNWAYQREPTHVCFYRDQTFLWIADQFDWQLARPHQNVAIFTKR